MTPSVTILKKIVALLIVGISIAVVLCMIILPQAYTSDVANSEAMAIQYLRNIAEAERTYFEKTGGSSYGSIEQLDRHGLIDDELEKAKRKGYDIELVVGEDKFQARATPSYYGVFKRYTKTGRRSFYMDETGILRSADKGGAKADKNDPNSFGYQ